jgi:hypothetical protein
LNGEHLHQSLIRGMTSRWLLQCEATLMATAGCALARAVTWNVSAATDLKEDVVSETFMAYLMGPAVMLMVGVVLWLATRHHGNAREGRSSRWLDTHYVDLMHHRH